MGWLREQGTVAHFLWGDIILSLFTFSTFLSPTLVSRTLNPSLAVKKLLFQMIISRGWKSRLWRLRGYMGDQCRANEDGDVLMKSWGACRQPVGSANSSLMQTDTDCPPMQDTWRTSVDAIHTQQPQHVAHSQQLSGVLHLIFSLSLKWSDRSNTVMVTLVISKL